MVMLDHQSINESKLLKKAVELAKKLQLFNGSFAATKATETITQEAQRTLLQTKVWKWAENQCTYRYDNSSFFNFFIFKISINSSDQDNSLGFAFARSANYHKYDSQYK